MLACSRSQEKVSLAGELMKGGGLAEVRKP